MKLEHSRGHYEYFSGTASEITRQLAFAALAVVWIFKVDKQGGGLEVPRALLWPSALAIVALAMDLLQYTYASLAWGFFNRLMELRHNRDETADFGAPKQINWPTIFFFWAKLAAVIGCYVLLLVYLAKELW